MMQCKLTCWSLKIYVLGKSKEYTLSENALAHIIHGDFTAKPLKDGKGGVEYVLSGGLHTWKAWQKTLASHQDIVHLQAFDPASHRAWYFARELQNGVITLKIPRELYSKDAANITMMPDIHYKSGYLWKTLFPTNYTDTDILEVIQEALINLDLEESILGQDQSILIGFARTMHPFTAIRIRIQLVGNEIRSAFPSWDQPYTGNNGKAYSHEHSISFHIAESTRGLENLPIPKSQFLSNEAINLKQLIELTPQFLLRRSPPLEGKIQGDWHSNRMEEIESYVYSAASEDLKHILNYLNDYLICKQPLISQRDLFYSRQLAPQSLPLKNATLIVQNFCDCFYSLLIFDELLSSTHLLLAMERFFSMAVIHTGGLCVLEYKRIIHHISFCIIEHSSPDSVERFLTSLAKSPIRSAVYAEFNVNPYVQESTLEGVSKVGTISVEMAFSFDHFKDFVCISMGENYLLNFDKKDREKFAMDSISYNYPDKFVNETMMYFRGEDFNFFAFFLLGLQDYCNGKNLPSQSSLINILRDYNRMLIMYRQRIVMEDFDAYEVDLSKYEKKDAQFFSIIKQKHKREFVLRTHEFMLQTVGKYAQTIGYLKLELTCKRFLSALPKERVPFPKLIPDYIPNWKQLPKFQEKRVYL